jgi:hypothetical protein
MAQVVIKALDVRLQKGGYLNGPCFHISVVHTSLTNVLDVDPYSIFIRDPMLGLNEKFKVGDG